MSITLVKPENWQQRTAPEKMRWLVTVHARLLGRFNDGGFPQADARRVWYPRFRTAGQEIAAVRRALWAAGTPAQKADPFWVPYDRQGVRADLSTAELSAIDLDQVFTGQAAAVQPPDPTEDLTTYTELDPGSDISVSSSTATVTTLTRTTDAWLYDDKGAGHFGDFEHDFDLNETAVDPAAVNVGVPWAVSNVVQDGNYWQLSNSQAVHLFWYSTAAARRLYLRDTENGIGDQDYWSGWAIGTTYYVTADRSGTSLDVRIYSDSGRSTLLDTISVTLAVGRTYRYVFAVDSYDDNLSGRPSWTTANLDLQEPPAGVPTHMDYYRRRRCA